MKNAMLLAIAFLTVAASTEVSVTRLVSELADPMTREQASMQLENAGKSSAEVRRQIAKELEGGIRKVSNSDLWRAEARLAGNLKLDSLAPELAQSLETDTRERPSGIVTMYRSMSPEYDPAVRALVEIGSPAIGPLRKEVRSGNRLGRFRSVYALMRISDPAATRELEERYVREPDPGLRALIGNHLGRE